MAKKTSTYARKRAHNQPGTVTYQIGDFVIARAKQRLHGLDNVIARCTPYKDNQFFDYKAILLPVHLALDGFINRTVPPEDRESYNALAFALNEAKARYLDIGGPGNPAIALIDKAADALMRTLDRYRRIGEWGLDGPAIQELTDGVSLYEDVLLESSPNQMHEAAMTSLRWITMQDADTKQAA